MARQAEAMPAPTSPEEEVPAGPPAAPEPSWAAVVDQHHPLDGASVLLLGTSAPDPWTRHGAASVTTDDVIPHGQDAGSVDVVAATGPWLPAADLGRWLDDIRTVLRPDGVVLLVAGNGLRPGRSSAGGPDGYARLRRTFAAMRALAVRHGYAVRSLTAEQQPDTWPAPGDAPWIRRLAGHRIGKFLAPTATVALLLTPTGHAHGDLRPGEDKGWRRASGGSPDGIRTRAAGLKGRYPRPAR